MSHIEVTVWTKRVCWWACARNNFWVFLVVLRGLEVLMLRNWKCTAWIQLFPAFLRFSRAEQCHGRVQHTDSAGKGSIYGGASAGWRKTIVFQLLAFLDRWYSTSFDRSNLGHSLVYPVAVSKLQSGNPLFSLKWEIQIVHGCFKQCDAPWSATQPTWDRSWKHFMTLHSRLFIDPFSQRRWASDLHSMRFWPTCALGNCPKTKSKRWWGDWEWKKGNSFSFLSISWYFIVFPIDCNFSISREAAYFCQSALIMFNRTHICTYVLFLPLLHFGVSSCIFPHRLAGCLDSEIPACWPNHLWIRFLEPSKDPAAGATLCLQQRPQVSRQPVRMSKRILRF